MFIFEKSFFFKQLRSNRNEKLKEKILLLFDASKIQKLKLIDKTIKIFEITE
jgi:hypothetical protein